MNTPIAELPAIAAAITGPFDAIVIGASAGGVEALSLLLPSLPAQAPAVLVVLHLPRDRPSLLVNVFAPKCAMHVCEAQDKEPILPGTIYFAPPDYHLLVDDGPQVALSADEPVNFSRPAIDVLFETAADYYRERLLGIVLTGGNHDGAAGLQAIRATGGTSLVQQPDDAQSSYMPEQAIKLGAVDGILPLHEMAALLHAVTRRK